MLRSTHTHANLEISHASYAEIEGKLRAAGYHHVFDGTVIDMHGIGIGLVPESVPSPEPWVVWSYEHDAWWGPASNGYRSSLMRAGLYSKAEAEKIAENANRYTNERHVSGLFEEAMSLSAAVERDALGWSLKGCVAEYVRLAR